MNLRFLIISALMTAIFVTACDRSQPTQEKTVDDQRSTAEQGVIKSGELPEDPQRIVSLAPNITEMIFELGQGHRLVGVSRYCDWPEAANDLPRVGGVLDPDYEAILATEAELVLGVSHDGQDTLGQRLATAELAYAFLMIEDFATIFDAIERIGQWLGAEEGAQELVAQINADLDAAGGRIEGFMGDEPPSVLLVFDREPVVVAGPNSFGDELLSRAGLTNALAGQDVGTYPVLDMEHIIETNPQIVIDVTYGPNAAEDSRRYWSRFEAIDAVENDRILHISDPVFLRPGPRIAQAVERLADALENL